jgi:hypothetical protein
MDWDIQKSSKMCSACERAFDEGESYFSALYDRGEQFERRDYCPPCWEADDDETEAFSFWKTHVPTQEEQRKLLVDDDVLVSFFLRLADEQQEQQPQHKRNFRYILALVLMRKKILRFVDIAREDDAEFLVLRYPREDREFRVRDPGLTEEEADTVKDDLSQILNVEV